VSLDVGSSRTTRAAPNVSGTGCETTTIISRPPEEEMAIPVPSSQESNTPTGREECLPVPHTTERRRKRPNKRIRPVGVDIGLPNPWAPHHSVHVKERRNVEYVQRD
jgi:hypothetical protein